MVCTVKFPKIGTPKIVTVIVLKWNNVGFYNVVMHPNDVKGIFADHDQTAP